MAKRERPIKLRARAYTGMPFPLCSYMMGYPRFSRHELDAQFMDPRASVVRAHFRSQILNLLGLSVALSRARRKHTRSNSPASRQHTFGPRTRSGRLPSFRQFLVRSIYVKEAT